MISIKNYYPEDSEKWGVGRFYLAWLPYKLMSSYIIKELDCINILKSVIHRGKLRKSTRSRINYNTYTETKR